MQENARLVRDDGRQAALLRRCTVQEITQRKNFERQLMVARRAADASNRAKSEFLATMSHELRTPLNAIMGFAQIMRDRWKEPQHGKISEYADDILVSAQHLYGLISEILDYSKIDSGTVQLVETPIDVGAMCEHCLHMIGERAPARRPAPEDRDRRPAKPALNADQRRVTQVLLNLATNAVKFTPSGGIGDDLGGTRRQQQSRSSPSRIPASASATRTSSTSSSHSCRSTARRTRKQEAAPVSAWRSART